MFTTVRNIRKKQWMKIWIIFLLYVVSFLGGLMAFLSIFISIPFPTDPVIEKHMTQPYANKPDFPKILHHSWKNDEIPPMWHESYNACLSLNSGYTFMLWTDEKIEEFMDEHYPWFKEQFDSYIYKIQKIDVFRYFVLYHYGGVYIDLDIQCLYPFSHILRNISKNHGMLLPGTWPVGVSNEFMVAKQYHPFLEFIISKLRFSHNEYGLHYFTILASTGPMFVSRCLETYPSPDARDIYKLPMKLHKWEYFRHIDGDTWQWWDMWLVNWWVSWLIFAAFCFCIIMLCVVKCCGYSNNGGGATRSIYYSPKYEKLRNETKSTFFSVGKHPKRQWHSM